MKFRIANSRHDPSRIPAGVTRLKKLLDSLPDGELLTYRDIELRGCGSQKTTTNAITHPVMSEYSTFGLIPAQGCQRRARLFANKKTIAAYNKEFGE